MKLKDACTLEEKLCNPRQHIKKQRHYFADKGPSSQSFSSIHVWMWELDYKESWVQKNWYFQTVVLEKTLESPLDSKELKPVHPKGNQPWIFTGKTDAEAETPILWPPYVKNWRILKDPDAFPDGKDWRQEEKGTMEGEMVGWHHRLNGHAFEQTQEMVKTGRPGGLQFMGAAKSQTQLKWLSRSSSMSIESMMPSNHLILCHLLLLLPSIFPTIRVFSNELGLF